MECTIPILTQREIDMGRDSVHQDMRLLGERNWKNLALNKEEWRKILKNARAHTGLSSQFPFLKLLT
jgi:hypothetical protein